MAARAYAADGQRDACLTALDTAHTTVQFADYNAPSYSTYSEAIHGGIRSLCHLELREGQHAVNYAQQALGVFGQSFVRDSALLTVGLGRAYVQCNEIDEASRLIGDASEVAAGNSSARLLDRLKQARADLQPWEHTTVVRTLDDRLASHGVS